MTIQPTPAPVKASIQIEKTHSVVEHSLRAILKTHDTTAVAQPAPRIVPPPAINGANISLDFSVDPTTGERVVKIVDKETGELIRQVPPQELLNVMQALHALKGLLLSTKS